MVYISNAFALSMLSTNETQVKIEKIDNEKVSQMLQEKFISAIGHQDLANILSTKLKTNIPMNRISIKIEKGDTLIVAQYVGPRLPEGTTTLPEGGKIEFFLVEITE